MRKLISTILAITMMLSLVAPVRAIDDSINASDLVEYTKHDNFKVSYSAFSEDDTIEVKFYYKEDGGTYSQFGPTLNTYSGEAQVTGTQVDDQGKYFFKVELITDNGTISDETSTTYDITGPSPVQDYSKEQVGGGHFKLTWRNPGDSDFSRVFVYRSTSTDFTADGSTKIGERGGAPDADMEFEDFGLDPDKTYYYALRAVDKAGNASSLVADPEVTATTTEEEEIVVTEAESEGEFVVLPQEEDAGDQEGEVLGEEEDGEADQAEEEVVETQSPSPTQESMSGAVQEARQRLFGTTKGKVAVAGALLLGFISYFIWRRK